MNKIEQIRQDMINAMKEHNKDKKLALSFLLGQLKNAEIEKRAELTEDEINQVILKEVKQIQETISAIPPEMANSRPDLINDNTFRLSIVAQYAPRMMDKSELRRVIYMVLGNLSIEEPKKSDKGKIMKELMPRVKGKADGKLVNEILDEYLK